MPLRVEFFPLSTPLDPAEEPPGSIDPLGTLSAAERLADVLLPGFTARMWRARLLTFTTVSAAIANRVVALMGGREAVRLEARLAFERFYVSAIVRMHHKDPGNYAGARRRLPGVDLARKALNAGEPLTRSNFLKGQAVNGPYGPVDRVIDVASLAVEAYETATTLFQQAFDGLMWNLKQHGGRAEPGVLLADPRMCTHLEGTVEELGSRIPILDRAIEQMRDASSLTSPSLIEPLTRLREEAVAASTSPHALVDTVLGRHEQVQREKRKSTWIDRESQWTLMPGFGVEGDAPAIYAGTDLHPFRILNTYSMLADLGQIFMETSDGEE